MTSWHVTAQSQRRIITWSLNLFAKWQKFWSGVIKTMPQIFLSTLPHSSQSQTHILSADGSFLISLYDAKQTKVLKLSFLFLFHILTLGGSFFLEKNILSYFINILSQKTSQLVKIQLLQTLSILITGLKSETSLCNLLLFHLSGPSSLLSWCIYKWTLIFVSSHEFFHITDYLLSNNYINDLITHRFDFSNEEVLGYYISFLKSLSLKLNDNTLQVIQIS